jgi:hypothetical protein
MKQGLKALISSGYGDNEGVERKEGDSKNKGRGNLHPALGHGWKKETVIV